MHSNTSNQQPVEDSNPLNDKSSFKAIINTLVWEDSLAIPDNVKMLRPDWDNHIFYLLGGCLSADSVGNGYSVYGGKLYKNLESGVEATDYTGELIFGDYFMAEDQDYQVVFKALFLKGLLQEITLFKNESQDPEVRKSMANGISVNVSKTIRIHNSIFYKYLYRPWRFSLRGLFYIFSAIWKTIHYLVFLIVKILTPW